jgi:hypothetical protein
LRAAVGVRVFEMDLVTVCPQTAHGCAVLSSIGVDNSYLTVSL